MSGPERECGRGSEHPAGAGPCSSREGLVTTCEDSTATVGGDVRSNPVSNVDPMMAPGVSTVLDDGPKTAKNGSVKVDAGSDIRFGGDCFTVWQIDYLEKMFLVNQYPSCSVRKKIGEALQLPERQVTNFFSWRRIMDKVKKDQDVANTSQEMPLDLSNPRLSSHESFSATHDPSRNASIWPQIGLPYWINPDSPSIPAFQYIEKWLRETPSLPNHYAEEIEGQDGVPRRPSDGQPMESVCSRSPVDSDPTDGAPRQKMPDTRRKKKNYTHSSLNPNSKIFVPRQLPGAVPARRDSFQPSNNPNPEDGDPQQLAGRDSSEPFINLDPKTGVPPQLPVAAPARRDSFQPSNNPDPEDGDSRQLAGALPRRGRYHLYLNPALNHGVPRYQIPGIRLAGRFPINPGAIHRIPRQESEFRDEEEREALIGVDGLMEHV